MSLSLEFGILVLPFRLQGPQEMEFFDLSSYKVFRGPQESGIHFRETAASTPKSTLLKTLVFTCSLSEALLKTLAFVWPGSTLAQLNWGLDSCLRVTLPDTTSSSFCSHHGQSIPLQCQDGTSVGCWSKPSQYILRRI